MSKTALREQSWNWNGIEMESIRVASIFKHAQEDTAQRNTRKYRYVKTSHYQPQAQPCMQRSPYQDLSAPTVLEALSLAASLPQHQTCPMISQNLRLHWIQAANAYPIQASYTTVCAHACVYVIIYACCTACNTCKECMHNNTYVYIYDTSVCMSAAGDCQDNSIFCSGTVGTLIQERQGAPQMASWWPKPNVQPFQFQDWPSAGHPACTSPPCL